MFTVSEQCKNNKTDASYKPPAFFLKLSLPPCSPVTFLFYSLALRGFHGLSAPACDTATVLSPTSPHLPRANVQPRPAGSQQPLGHRTIKLRQELSEGALSQKGIGLFIHRFKGTLVCIRKRSFISSNTRR